MINVLHLNYDNYGGAGIAASRLNVELGKVDLGSNLLVRRSYSNLETGNLVIHDKNVFKKITTRVSEVIASKVNRKSYNSLNLFGVGLANKINYIDPTILHLHWIGGELLSLSELKKMQLPIVWTLHDMWPITATEHYIDDDKFASQLISPNSFEGDPISRYVLRRKIRIMEKQNIHFIAPSNWIANAARESIITRNNQIHVIPNGIDTNEWKCIPKETARNILGLDKASKIILFGAINSLADKRKGGEILFKALSLIKDTTDIELIIFGSRKAIMFDGFKKIHNFGEIRNNIHLNLLYAASDLFLLPSLQDNLPNTGLESLASGTPILAFNVGGLSDIIDDEKNGFLCDDIDAEKFSTKIVTCLERVSNDLMYSNLARNKSITTFDIRNIARRHKDLYQTILEEDRR